MIWSLISVESHYVVIIPSWNLAVIHFMILREMNVEGTRNVFPVMYQNNYELRKRIKNIRLNFFNAKTSWLLRFIKIPVNQLYRVKTWHDKYDF